MSSKNFIWPHRPAWDGPTPQPHVWLRVMETTDVHAHLMPFDYDRNREVENYGLARVATLIDRARAEAANSLLFDNGDFLQGSALSDLATSPGASWSGPNPIITVMNAMGYDAACLGNHEFNFGLDWLRQSLAQAKFPVLCANAIRVQSDGAQPAPHPGTLVPPSQIIDIDAFDNNGETHRIKVGVLGLVPPQITSWDHTHLYGRVTTRGIVAAARDEVPRLRAGGAQIVIALTHSGIAPSMSSGLAEDSEEQEHAALAMARLVPGIDAILSGHSHQVFPAPGTRPEASDVDPALGTLANVPTVLAGYRGSHLGVIDLCLVPDGSPKGWRVATHNCAARPVAPAPNAPPVPPHPVVTDLASPAHIATLRLTAQPVTTSHHPLHSYLAKLLPCPTLNPVLAAQALALTKALADTPHARLPVLAATAPFKSGGHGGPGFYVDIPAGPLTRGNLAELYPFPNTLIGVRASGAQLAIWLERAASCFNQITTDTTEGPQPLWNTAFSPHALDTIGGLTYDIDLSQPPRFDARGALINPDAQRVTAVYHNGARVAPDAEFAVATNNFRAFGGGPYDAIPPERILHASPRKVGDLLLETTQHHGLSALNPVAGDWQLTGPEGTSVLLETGPGVRQHQKDLAAIGAFDMGNTAEGFACFSVPLCATARVANPDRSAYVKH